MDQALEPYLHRREEILSRLRTILVEGLHLDRTVDELDPDASLFGTGLALDSIDAVELLVAVEEEFGIDLAEHQQESPQMAMRTLNTMADLLQQERLEGSP